MFWSKLNKIQRAILKKRARRTGMPKYQGPPPPPPLPQKSMEVTKEEAELETLLKFVEIMKEGGWMVINVDTDLCPECRKKLPQSPILMISV